MKSAGRQISSIALLLLFSFYFVNITFFPHAHHVGNLVIVHSHFYNGQDAKGEPLHSHSSSELVVIHDLSILLTTAMILPALVFMVRDAIRIHYPRISCRLVSIRPAALWQPRAPPLAG